MSRKRRRFQNYNIILCLPDRERQLEILGPGRMGMYERGKLGFSDMVRMDGSPMTLKELEAK